MCSGHLRGGDVEPAVVCFNPMALEHVFELCTRRGRNV